MKIILSPAKKMKTETDILKATGLPLFLEKTEEIFSWLKSKSKKELQAIWKCNEKIAQLNYDRLSTMDLRQNLTPAVLAYDGLAFQHMAPVVFEDKHFDYVEEHLCILSAFYGVLRAMDGVTPYRLEMQAKAAIGEKRDMYDFWGDLLYRAVCDKSRVIINLASKEYSKCIEKYLSVKDRYITINFCEKQGEKLVTKGTYAKMARGEMVRFMAENKIEDPNSLKEFTRLGYVFEKSLSSESEFVFMKGTALNPDN